MRAACNKKSGRDRGEKFASKLQDRTVVAKAKAREGGKARERERERERGQGCQMAKFDPFLSLDCARVEGVGAEP